MHVIKKNFRFLSVGAAALVATVALVSAQSTTNVGSLGVDVAGMDRSVRPQDDFFRYVNGAWVDKTPIPADLASYGSFTVLREDAAVALRRIIEDAAAQKDAAPGSTEQKVGDLYRSFMDASRIESLGIKPLANELAAIGRVKRTADLPGAFAHALQIGGRTPFTANVGQDPKNSSVYAVLMGQSGLGMPDRDYYLRQDEQFGPIRTAYTGYIAQLFTLAFSTIVFSANEPALQSTYSSWTVGDETAPLRILRNAFTLPPARLGKMRRKWRHPANITGARIDHRTRCCKR